MGLRILVPPLDAEMAVHCLNGLSEQYESTADLISLMPGMTFTQCRSLLALQDMKRKNRHARNSDTALFTNTGNPGKAPGKGKKKKKAAARVTKEIIPAPATPQAATPSWPSPQHPWNGAIQMWPYGQGGCSFARRPAMPLLPATRPGTPHRRMRSTPRTRTALLPTATATPLDSPPTVSLARLHHHRHQLRLHGTRPRSCISSKPWDCKHPPGSG